MAPKKPWWDVSEDAAGQPLGPTPATQSTGIDPAPPKASVSPGGKPWWEVDLTPAVEAPVADAEPTPEEVSALSMEQRLSREQESVKTGAKTLQRVARQAVESGAFPAVPQVVEELARANQTYPDLMPDEVAQHFEQKAAAPPSLFGHEVPGWFRTALEAMPVLNPMLSASDYSEGKTSLGTAYVEGLPIRALSRTIRGVLGDENAVQTNPLTKIGLAASTLSRPAAAIARGITDNMMAEKGLVDPRTGEPMKRKDSSEIVDEVMDTLSPIPGTRRAQVSYIDVAANISRLNGGEGNEWPVYVGGLAGDILLDPAFYLTFGGSSVGKASSQAQRILQRVYSASGGRLAQESLESSQKVAQWFASQLGRTDLNKASKLQILERMAAKTEALGTKEAAAGAQQLRDLGPAWGQMGGRLHVPLAGAPAAAEDLAKGLARLADALSEKGMPRLSRFAESADIIPGRRLAEKLSRGVEIPGLRGEQIAAAKAGAKRAVVSAADRAVVGVDELAAKYPKWANQGAGSPGARLHRAFIGVARRAHDVFDPGVHPFATNNERRVVEIAESLADYQANAASRTASDLAHIQAGRPSAVESEMITGALGAVQNEARRALNPEGKGGLKRFDFARIPEDVLGGVKSTADFENIGTALTRALSKSPTSAEARANWVSAVNLLLGKYGVNTLNRQRLIESGNQIIDQIAGPQTKAGDQWVAGLSAVRKSKSSPVRDAMLRDSEAFGLAKTPLDLNTKISLADAAERNYAVALHLEHEGILDPAKHATAADWYNDVGLRRIMQSVPEEQRALVEPHVAPMVADISTHLPASSAAVTKTWGDLDTGLRPVADYFRRKFDDIIAAEKAAGLEPESMPGFVPLLIRNKDSIFKKLGLREASFGEMANSEKGRRVRSLVEADELGLDPVRDVFRLYGAAKHAHDIKMRGHKFTGEIARQFGRQITDEAKLAGRKPGQALAPNELEHMGKVYEVDPDVARGFEKVKKLWEPEKIGDVMATWNGMTNWWKTRATVARLGFHLRNAWSNMWNMYAGGWSGKQFGRAIEVGLLGHLDSAEAIALGRQLRSGSPSRVGGRGMQFVDRKVDKMQDWLMARAKRAEGKQVVAENGRVWTYRQLYDEARRHGVIDKGWVAAEIDDSGMNQLGKHPDYATARGVLGAMNPLGKQFVGIRMGGKLGKGVENHARMTLFLDRVLGEAGDGTMAAAQHVKKYLFDYKALTPAEKTLKRSAVPFYTWIRKNLPLQMEQVFRNPGRMALPFKLKRATDKRYDDLGGQILDEEMPAWIRNAYGMRIPGQVPFMPDIGSTAVWMPDMPYRDLNVLKLDDGEGFFSQINPLLKLPFELNRGETLTRERKFKMVEAPFGTETVLSTIPGVKIVPWTDEATGRTINMVDERALYVLQTMLPDVFTWQRLLLPGAKDPVELEKSRGRQVADVTGIGRVNFLRPEQERGQRMKERAETIRQWTPRGAKVKPNE